MAGLKEAGKNIMELSRRDKLLASGYDKTGMAVDHS